MKILQDRVAIVTGASKGIGKAICKAFSSEGAKIVATSSSMETMSGLINELKQIKADAIYIPADLGSEAEIQQIPQEALKQYGCIDILVNSAGLIHPSMELVNFDSDSWRRVIDINLVAPAMLIKAVLPTMIKNQSGKIINISSIGGRKGGKGRSAYRASKAGLINLTESVAAEVKSFGIEVNCICPSATDTEGYRMNIDPEGRDQNPRVMMPEQIADIVVFLASDASSAITGTSIDAFGGTNPLFT